MKRDWLAAVEWNVVIATNQQLCSAGNALHRPTSDGYERTRNLWESAHRQPMTIAEAAELCRRCHRLAPFCNFNGNTFVVIIRNVIGSLGVSTEQTAILRSVAGHIVAGTAAPDEQETFQAALERINAS